MSTLENGRSPASTAGSLGSSPASGAGETGKKDGIRFREACLKLGISEKTLRARIHNGEVDGWTVEGKRGLEWRVRLPGEREEGRAPERECRAPGRDGEREGRDEARDQIQRQAEEIDFLRAQLAARTTAEEQLRVLLMQLEKTNAELAGALVVKALPPATPVRLRWWRWLFR